MLLERLFSVGPVWFRVEQLVDAYFARIFAGCFFVAFSCPRYFDHSLGQGFGRACAFLVGAAVSYYFWKRQQNKGSTVS